MGTKRKYNFFKNIYIDQNFVMVAVYLMFLQLFGEIFLSVQRVVDSKGNLFKESKDVTGENGPD